MSDAPNPTDAKRTFTVDETFYKGQLEPKIGDLFVPVSLTHFVFSLPFRFPVKEGTLLHLLHDNALLAYHLDTFFEESIEPLFGGGRGVAFAMARTRVEAVMVSKEDLSLLDPPAIEWNLFNVLNGLNSFVNAYRIICEDWKTRPVTAENLRSAIHQRTIMVKGWNVLVDAPLLVNLNYENIIGDLPSQYARVVQGLGAYLTRGKNPFSVPYIHFADARTHLYNGFYRESILSSQMAVESTIRLIYRYALEKNGLNEPDIQELLEQTPFMRLVKQEMPKILGGSWDVKDPNLVVGKWYQTVYKKRNGIIHAGYVPYGYEARKCFVTAHEFLTAITALIKSKQHEQPALFELCKYFPEYLLHGEGLKFIFG